MSLLLFVVLAIAFAGLAAVLRGGPGPADRRSGCIGLVAAVIAALAIDPGQVVDIGGGGIADDRVPPALPRPRLAVGLGLAVLGPRRRLAPRRAGGDPRHPRRPRADPRPCRRAGRVLVATAGGLFGVLVTLIPGNGRAGATVGIRETRAVIVAGALAIAATAWFGRDLSQLAAQPVVFGLAYLAFAVAVAMRFGAIPFHLWAARLTDVVPETALPILTAMAPASLAIVALAWTDAVGHAAAGDARPARCSCSAIAVASIFLAAIAAFVQDDLEHVLGYSIIGDAGVVMLALATLIPEAWAPARTWILIFVVDPQRVRRLGRRHPGGLLHRPGRRPARLGLAVAAPGRGVRAGRHRVGRLPGTRLVRRPQVHRRPGPRRPDRDVVLLGTLAPLAYYGRLLVIGLAPAGPAAPSRATRGDRTCSRAGRAAIAAWLGPTSGTINRAFTTAVLAVLLGGLALATPAGAFGGRRPPSGLPPTSSGPGEIVSPSELRARSRPSRIESVEP